MSDPARIERRIVLALAVLAAVLAAAVAGLERRDAVRLEVVREEEAPR